MTNSIVTALWLLPLLIFYSLLLSQPTFAKLVNVTIDDQNGDPVTGNHITYGPQDAWQDGQTCTNCSARGIIASYTYSGTWIDASYNPGSASVNAYAGTLIQASVKFTGE